MHRNYRIANITRAIVAVAIIVAFGGPFVDSAQGADRKVVKVAVDEVGSGTTRIRVYPRDAGLWRNTPGKAQNIRWWMVKNRSSYPQIFWEFRFDPSREGATEDYFGDVDIECGGKHVDVAPEMKPDSVNAVWPYTITAYACSKGAKAQKIATGNARIVWKD
jgi:hypothetical protein